MRIDFHELVEKLYTNKDSKGLHIVLNDDALIPYIINKVHRPSGLKTYENKTAMTDFVDSLSQGSLFGEVNPSLVFLNEKYTEKQWDAVVQELNRIPEPKSIPPSFLIGSASLRNTVKEPALKNVSTIRLAYAPNEMDSHKTMRVLTQHYQVKSSADLASSLAEHYGTDFVAADTHLDRMVKGQLNFQDALLNQTQADAFQVVDALIRNNSEQLVLRISQCQASGIDAASLFGSLNYFFKQLLAVQSAVEQGNTIKQAFDTLRIPYPAQGRLQQACRQISGDKILTFFKTAAHNELLLRKAKNPFDALTIELLAFIT